MPFPRRSAVTTTRLITPRVDSSIGLAYERRTMEWKSAASPWKGLLLGLPMLLATVTSPAAYAQELQLPEGPEAPGQAKVAAADERIGQATVRVGTLALAPFGGWSSTWTAQQQSALAPALRAETGLGLGRYAELEATWDYSQLRSGPGCASCGGSSSAFAIGLAHHLVQGLAIDPWVRFGLGLRTVHQEVSATGKALGATSVRGLDWARVTVGADYRPRPHLGLGLFVEADLGTTVADATQSPAGYGYAFLGAGARFSYGPFPTR